MPEGQIVGRISVKILPDTSDYKEKARKELDRIERQLKVTVGATLDTTALKREALEAVRDISRTNRATDARKIRFFATIGTEGMTAAVRSAARELRERAKAQKIDFKIRDLQVTGKVHLELDQHSADSAERKLRDWADKVSPLKVPVQPEYAHGSGLALSARLQVLTRPRTVPIVPTLDHGAAAKVATALAALSGARVLQRMFERLSDTIRNLDRSVPVIGSLAEAVAGLAGFALTAASNLAALSSSLASIGSLSLLLPGLLGGIAVGLGVTIAALRDFSKVVPQAKAALGGLQDTISQNFWEQAAKPIREMVDGLLPRFTAGVNATATQLGSFFGGLAASLQHALDPALEQMFTDLAASIEVATAGTAAYAQIITVLGRVGTSYLPALAEWFVTLANRFASFLTATEGDGRLKAWIDEGLQSLQDLGSVLSHTGGILAGVARAAEEAGGSSLGMMADTLGRIHAVVDSPGFQAGLTGVFAAAHTAMDNIATTSGPAVKALFTELGQLLTAVLPMVGATIGVALSAVAAALAQPAVTEGVKTLFAGLQVAVAALAPAMAPVGQALGALMEVVAAFAAQLGPLIAAALIPLATAFVQLAPVITPVIELLGGALTEILTTLAPLFLMLVAAVAPLIEQLVGGLAPIVPVIVAALGVMVAAVQPVIAVLLDLLTAVVTPLLPVIAQLAETFLPQVAAAFASVMEAVRPLLEALLGLVEFLMPVLAPAITFVAGLLLGSLVAALNGVAQVFRGVTNIILGLWNVFAGIFTGDWSRVWSGIKQFFSGVWEAIKGVINVALNVGVLGVARKALGVLKGVWQSGWNAVKSVGTSVWNAIRGGVGVLMTALRGYVDDGIAALKSVWSSGWSAIGRLLTAAWEGIKSGVVSGVRSAVSAVRELPGQARRALGSIGSVLIDAGKSLIRGLISGITSMFSSVKNKLGELTSKLTDWKGPAPKDGVLLYDAGKLIIKGLIRGLESEYDNVRQSLNDLTAKIPKNASKGLKDRINKDRTALLKLTAQWEGAGKKLEAARDRLDSLRKEAASYAASIAQKIIDTGDVAKVEDSSFAGLTASLTGAIERAKRFAAALAKLKDLGLGTTALDQIASAGPDAGLAAAESIAAAGKAGVAEINRLQNELAQYANSAGATASSAMYDAGIHMAEGLVKGLSAQQAAIEKQMLKIADAMVAAIKKSLKIHSPSRVFAKLGGFVGQGFAKGIRAERGHVADAVTDLTRTPTSADYSAASTVLSSAVSRGLGGAPSPTGGTTKILNYYAAPGSSLSSTEELFAAAGRARMVGW
ncbi:hypothetical protein ACH5AU_31305 [Streptomyces albidoflavus]